MATGRRAWRRGDAWHGDGAAEVRAALREVGAAGHEEGHGPGLGRHPRGGGRDLSRLVGLPSWNR